ncbi:MAG: phospho-N-acetylmuramoyl-pentapeptide-transferase [Lentisphaerae bacterium]|nr:phospho-N-acetylmuramoyl-pentapeptide-transferase [Lentisphaerota bacterium]
MLYFFAAKLSEIWGPFRLFGSHLILLALGTLTAGAAVYLFLPRLWKRLPHDRGRKFVKGSEKSVGKPTGAGLIISLIVLPIILLVMPFDLWNLGLLLSLYFCMLCGYLDDASIVPWGELKKGLLDLFIALAAAYFLSKGEAVTIWLPVYKDPITIPLIAYLPIATIVLWLTTNATNCSDGVDGLAGSLTLISLFSMGALLYGVTGYRPVADYLLIPHYPDGARWAILTFTMAGGLAGYLWHNAEPSRVLMGDAGSRLLGLLVGVAALAAGNPLLVIVVAPVVLVNGGTGLFKLGLLRILKKIGFDTTPPDTNLKQSPNGQHVFVKILHKIRFPLHDHCRHNKKWSNAQVLMRFVLIQSFLTPLLFVLLVKIR